MRLFGPLLFALSLAGSVADAQDRRFPYEAVVDVDEEFIRSGPGRVYFPTGKLARGDKVAVHRHDPGGWYMIAPPDGSFSWIQAEYVQRIDDKRGRLTANNVIVYVGSSLADERSVYQRTLSKGDTVEILDETIVNGERGPVSLYKIKPPSREYRWITGKSVVPAEGYRGRPAPKFKPNLDPAPSIKGPIALEVDPNGEAFAPSPFQPDTKQEPQPPVKTGEQAPKDQPDESSLEAQRDELHELDRQFREMVVQDPTSWNLASLEQSYKSLDEATEHPSIRSSLQHRLRTVEKYARIQQDYVEFHQLTIATRQRDTQLASLQNQLEGAPQTPSRAAAAQAPAAHAPGPPVPRRPGMPFDGAGIIERAAVSPPGAPPFVLVNPDGRRLAYLQPPPGLDLNRYLRQSMGIYGERSHRPDFQSDLIVIRGMQPVRLRTGP